MSPMRKYTNTDLVSSSQNELEVRALVRTASALNVIKEDFENRKEELDEALDKNKRLWTLFASNMAEESSGSIEIRNSILSLAVYVFKETINIIANPDLKKLEALININMEVARGLQEGAKAVVNENNGIQDESHEDGSDASKTTEEKDSEEIDEEYKNIFG